MSLALSLINHVATATITASSAQSGYPVSFLADYTHPDIPWKTMATGDQWALVDHGGAKLVEIAAPLYANFATIRLQANATNLGTPPWVGASFDQTLTIGRNTGNSRLCRWLIPAAALNYRYNLWFIPSQTPTDGASYYRLGTIWSGPVIYRRNFRWDYDPTPTQNKEVVKSLGGTTQVSILGPRRMRLAFTRNAFTVKKSDGTSTAALLDDGVAEWMQTEDEWNDAGQALVVPGLDNNYWVGVMRIESVSRKVGYPVDEVQVVLEEMA